MTPEPKLLRFISKDLPVQTQIETVDDDTIMVLYCEGVEIGRRRLNKRQCCNQTSPCIGPVKIARQHQARFNLPGFVHITICFDEIEKEKHGH